MIINRVTIDGYRNTKYTELEFDEPIIVLVSPNNLGKSNLLKAIQDGFDLIAKQGIQVENYIENSDNYADWSINQSESGNFTFKVEYIRNFDPDTTYTYRFSLGYRVVENAARNKPKSEALGVQEEWLKAENKKKGVEKTLFIRKVSTKERREDFIILNPKTDREHTFVIPSIGRGSGLYESKHYLALHKIGGMALDNNWQEETKETIKEITGVLITLANENIGDVILDEVSGFSDIRELTGRMHKTDPNKEYPGEWYFIKEEYQKLFQYYRSVSEEKYERPDMNEDMSGIRMVPLGDSGKYEVLFKDTQRRCEETFRTLSFGTRRVFEILCQIISNYTPLFSIEEIAIGIHPELFHGLVDALFSAVDDEKYESKTGTKRRHKPRIIITTHSTGIVNALYRPEEHKNRLDSIYFCNTALAKSRVAQFARLSELGKEEVKYGIDFSDFRAGDILFSLFAEKERLQENLPLLDIKNDKGKV